MLDATTIDTIARAYHQAEKTRQRIRPPSVQYPGFTIEGAYAVQRRWVDIKLSEGNHIKGHKIGLTSRAMQRQANITEPDYGSLMADMFYTDGAEIPASRFIQPRFECEIGFVIGRSLKEPDWTILGGVGSSDFVA